jgi:RNA polymerase sigma-70 factor (ECF subfamily)
MAEPSPGAAQLLAAARAGSQEALGQVLETCRAYLLRIANDELDDPRLRAKGGASDIVQTTFLEAQQYFAHFTGSSANELRAWLRRLLRNNLANFRRAFQNDKRGVDRERPLATGSSSGQGEAGMTANIHSPSWQAMKKEQLEAMNQALQRLPEDYRRVILLRYQEERSFEEIGKLLGKTANGAQKLWGRAIDRLQQEMKGWL